MLAPYAFEENSSEFAGELCEALIKQGHTTLFPIGDENAGKLLQQFASDKSIGSWSRPSSAFAEAYLGSESSSAILRFDDLLQLGPQHQELASASGWYPAIQPMAEACATLQSVTERLLGFRSTGEPAELMLRKESSATLSPSSQEVDIAKHLDFLRQRRICIMSFVACEPGGKITLSPARPDLGWQSEELEITEGMLLIFRNDLLSYCYRPAGTADLVLQAWIMEADQQVQLSPIQASELDIMQFLEKPEFKVPKTHHPRITGMGGLAIESRGADEWYQHVSIGCDGVMEVPQLRWDMDLYYSPDLADGLSWSKHLGLIDTQTMDMFDNDFWKIDAGHTKLIVRQKLKALEAGYETLHDAGFTRETMRNAPISIGMGSSQHMNPDNFGLEVSPHMLDCSFVTLHLGLTGRSFLVDTACSASMISTHELHRDMMMDQHARPYEMLGHGYRTQALSMGVLSQYNPMMMIGNSQARMMGASGRSMSFDISANGFGCGEAILGIYFCREDTAEVASSGRCAIIGTATNNDGRSATLTAPNGPAQTICFRQSLRNSGTIPCEVTMNENHCTGTKLGDPIELGSTRGAFFSKPEDRPRPLPHGGFKSTTGHPFVAAGIAAIMKQVMTMQYAKVPPNVHLRTFNDNADMAGYPALVGNEAYDMGQTTMIIGCTGMGFGGSNARVDMMATCTRGIHAIPPMASFSSHTIAYLDRMPVSKKKAQEADVSHVLRKCAVCSGDMFLRSGLAVVTERDYIQEQHGSLVREASAPYDVCSMCYKGRYVKGVSPKNAETGNGVDVYVVGSWNKWSSPQLMEHSLDEYGDVCHVATVTLDASSRAEFRFVLDTTLDQALYPVVNKADQKARVLGPDGGHAGRSWLIDGLADGMPPGALCKVKFKWNYEGKAVEWCAADEDLALEIVKAQRPKFSIVGSWNAWSLEKMTCTDSKPSTVEYEVDVMIGVQAVEEFYFIQNGDRAQAIFPATFQAWLSDWKVLGPAVNKYGNAWIVRGEVGEVAKIKLQVADWGKDTSTIFVTTLTEGYGQHTWSNNRSKSE